METLERRHLDYIVGDAVKRTVSAVSDGCSQGREEVFRSFDASHRVECRYGFRVINFRQSFDLLDVEYGIAFHVRDFELDILARLAVALGAGDGMGKDDQ